ncbi:fructose bisphosphate aldolase [Pseudonocardia sp.]|uniref:fructose bisphosphate aldolase n=1 Tax=Pseudonocardia sp. TaxID=60912 RepID=UPI00260D2BF9|nr:fructose bisphosphate aldolase [Pseudonocardia sp.]MCW2721616.1 fructose bisphosphate aldolase [Pseudonocardia sp.]
MNTEQQQRVRSGKGFFAALDQSGGSTPKALALYGVGEDAYGSDAEMFDQVHAMRTRIMTSPAFTGDKVIGAILFEDTMDRQVDGSDTGDHLWNVKGVVPFLKVDKGLEKQADGVQLMKPIPDLDDLLARGVRKGMFGTKMRSFVKSADKAGIEAIVDQQFALGRRILDAGLVPILEPEVDIHSEQKADAEHLLRAAIAGHLDELPDDRQVMLKLSLPSEDGFYGEFVEHPRVLRVLALSGGYSRVEADAILTRNPGVIASFSRALTEGLHADQTDEEFDARLGEAIDAIYRASIT